MPSAFNSSFNLSLDSNFTYTYKSQYLKDVSLIGSNESSIIGNNYNNHFTGNNGKNYFIGEGGSDTLNGGLGLDKAVYFGSLDEYIVVPMDEPSDSAFRVIDIVNNRDGIDYLKNIEQIEFDGEIFFILDLLKLDNEIIPSHFKLEKPFPNPFNPIINIRFSIAKRSMVNLKIYDLKGQVIQSLTDKNYNAGNYILNWDAKDTFGHQVPTGVYFLKLFIEGQYQKTEKVLFLK